MKIDVCIPTWNSSDVLGKALDVLAESSAFAGVTVNKIILVDNLSEDKTVNIARSKANKYKWKVDIKNIKSSLPKAREIASEAVEMPWFLFLDDDVRLSKRYLKQLMGCIAPGIGAIQGRKKTSSGKPWEWLQRRVYRGGTHATLIRTEAISGLKIPKGVEVLEDEFIRRYIELNGYIWVFNHRARFEHDSMERHPIGWKQGYIAGRYGLMPFHSVVLLIGDAIWSMRNPTGRVALLFGWLRGAADKGKQEKDNPHDNLR